MLKLYTIFLNQRTKYTTLLNKDIQFLLIEYFFISIITCLHKH